MDEVLNLLQGIKPNVNFELEEELVESGLLDSLDIVAIIDAVQDHFKIEMDGKDIEPDNFMSVTTIWNMVEKYIR